MTTHHTEPDEAEARAALLRLGARPAGHALTDDVDDQAAAPAAPAAVPPMPDRPPTVGVPGPRRDGAPRLPDWWNSHKPELSVVDEQPEPAADTDEHDDAGDEPAAPESRRHRVLRILKGERAADSSERDDEDEDEIRETGGRRPRLRRVSKEPAADQGEESGEYDDEIRPAGEGRGRWRRPAATSGYERPRFSTPVFPRAGRERKSFAQAWREVDPATKWGLYHLTGLAGGLMLGVVGYATDVTASLAESPLPLRDNPAAYFWGAGAVLVVAVDRVTRRWFWLIGWCTRAVTTSVVVGAVLHGFTAGEAVANMPTLLDHLAHQH
ncbi:hypothetical protein ACFOOM_01130 [Streptomyces echinoruber]|uniref:Uncharacterized protein n=1 Tax=Streptomyces echinoruber TaxID=68898 RepID=A0A918QVX0_9ACTN|nr:hypothetical protein [Streptomyces echinoruber]GGZ73038.1 hypothetical protein GCM10010389_08070 [Streptomyces echinoruber]